LKLKGTESKSVKSSKKKVATVDKTGRVIGKKAGTATISLTGKNGKTYKCNVTIKNARKAYDGYDEFGNGYIIGPDGEKYFDCDVPYTLYTITTRNGYEGFYCHLEAEKDLENEKYWDCIEYLCEKYSSQNQDFIAYYNSDGDNGIVFYYFYNK